MPRRNSYVKGYKVVIKKHVIDQYMARAGVDEEEAKSTLERKFRDSRLTQLMNKGFERRMEKGGSLDKRLIFVAKKEGRTFIVITCYLQGKRTSWWKNEGLIKEPLVAKEEFEMQKAAITEELQQYFEEEVKNG
jgi:hypothetical protein